MPEYSRPTSAAEFDKNFAQIKPLMNATMAYYESARCLFCYDAPCVTACPTGIDIPLFIRQINTNNVNGAARTIYAANYFGNACGKVCPTEVLCEGACVYNEQDVNPIEIGRLQSFATTQAMNHRMPLASLAPANGKSVAIVGAGPAGIACACELREMGYAVDIFEAKDRPSGLALHGTAPYKITNEELLDEIQYLQDEFGFQMFFNRKINTKEEVAEIENKYDAIFLGIGLGHTGRLRMDGEDLDGCIGAVEFIEQLKLDPLHVPVGKRVVVIGGGNTAMDAASESARMGATDVILAYRRSKDAMRAYEFEYDLAKSVGVKGLFNVQPIAILGDASVEGVRFTRTRMAQGKLVEIPGSEFNIKCDMVIKATGQQKQRSLLDLMGVVYDNKGVISVNPETMQCGDSMYFAGGDAVNGGAEVVNACAEGKLAAQGIDQWLS